MTTSLMTTTSSQLATILRSLMGAAFLLHRAGNPDSSSLCFASSPLPLDFLALQRSNAGCSFSSGAPWWRLCVVSPSAPSCGLGVMSEVFQTGGPELREGEEKGGGRGGKRGWRTSLTSLLFLLSPCFAGWDEFLCADCGLPSSNRRLDKRQENRSLQLLIKVM